MQVTLPSFKSLRVSLKSSNPRKKSIFRVPTIGNSNGWKKCRRVGHYGLRQEEFSSFCDDGSRDRRSRLQGAAGRRGLSSEGWKTGGWRPRGDQRSDATLPDTLMSVMVLSWTLFRMTTLLLVGQCPGPRLERTTFSSMVHWLPLTLMPLPGLRAQTLLRLPTR